MRHLRMSPEVYIIRVMKPTFEGRLDDNVAISLMLNIRRFIYYSAGRSSKIMTMQSSIIRQLKQDLYD